MYKPFKSKEREEELINALNNIKIDVLGLCEVRRLGEAIVDKHNGYIFCYKGQTKGQRGVGFLIKKEVNHMIQEITGISERIMVLILRTNKKQTIKII